MSNNKKRWRFWVYNLNTDQGKHVNSPETLAREIESLLAVGVALEDIGISLEWRDGE